MKNLAEYLDALASADPVPGGGSASASVAAHGAALVAMAARITLNGARYTAVHAQAQVFIHQADELRAKLGVAGREDERAYDAVRAALALPKETPAQTSERAQTRELALHAAALAPLLIAELAAQVGVLAQAALALGNKHLESDLLCAAEFASSSANAASANVLINHQSMTDADVCGAQQARLLKACETADAACAALRSHFASHTIKPAG
jgi:formiminotetrahydrofolate cyclodeaminase